MMKNLQVNEINSFISDVKLNNLNSREIYRKLLQYKVDPEYVNRDMTSLRDFCSNIPEVLISQIEEKRKTSSEYDLFRSYIKLQSPEKYTFKHINASFNHKNEAGVRDIVKLYIPIHFKHLPESLSKIYQFLFDNKIDFQSKIAGEIRSDLFCLRVNSKENAKKVIDFCKKDKQISGNYTKLNPFLAQSDGIGVAQDTYHQSYNEYVSRILEEYKKRTPKISNASFDLQDFVKTKYLTAKDTRNKYMSSVFLRNLESINSRTDIFVYLKDKYNITFDANLFYQYERFHDGKNYFYKDESGTTISKDTNPELYLKLQANNFLHKIHLNYYKENPEKDFVLNETISKQISQRLDDILDLNLKSLSNCEINAIYDDPKIAELTPYFYANFAKEHKFTNSYETYQLINHVQKSIVKKEDERIKQETSKNLPNYVISVADGTVVINKTSENMCNILLKKADKIKRYRNVSLELNDELMKEISDISKAYRSSIANILLDEERNQRMINDRKGHFGIFEYNPHEKNVAKFYDPESIRKLYAERKGKNLEIEVEEEIASKAR